MAEVLTEKPKRLEFEVLYPGDILSITTGHDNEAWLYGFSVNNVSGWPTGTLQALSPEDIASEPVEFELHGSGRWTTREQNPVQKQGRAFTPYYHGLIVGDFLLGRFVRHPDRVVFDKPGQEISEVAFTPYRENTVLRIIASQVGAMSVRQIVELTKGEAQSLEERAVRATLTKLVKSGLVSESRKKVLRYELSQTA